MTFSEKLTFYDVPDRATKDIVIIAVFSIIESGYTTELTSVLVRRLGVIGFTTPLTTLGAESMSLKDFMISGVEFPIDFFINYPKTKFSFYGTYKITDAIFNEMYIL